MWERWDNSETAYGEVAREILLTGDPIVMHLNGAPWFVQPPLYFWAAALIAKLLGASALALRLPSALATIAMGGLLGLCAGRLVNLRAAVFSSVILSTCLMQAVIGRMAIMDALLDFFVTLTILAAFFALRGGCERYWYIAWIAAALGFLTKGPVALAIPLLVVGVWALWEYRRGGVLAAPTLRAWAVGALFFVALVMPWLALLGHAAGPTALSELLGHYTVGRYLGTIENQSGPLWYYVPVAILGFFPWIAFLAPALVSGWKNAMGSDVSSSAQFTRLCTVWAIAPFVFFSFAQTKLPNYIALEIPALALLTGFWFDAILTRGNRRALLGWAALVPFTIGALGLAIRIFSQTNRLTGDMQSIMGDVTLLGRLLLIGSIVCMLLFAFKRTTRFGVPALAAASLCAMFVISFIAEPHAERFKPIPVLAQTIARERRAGDTVAVWGVAGANALVFYTRPGVVEFTPPFETRDVRERICGQGRLLLVTAPTRAARVAAYDRRRSVHAVLGRTRSICTTAPRAESPKTLVLGA